MKMQSIPREKCKTYRGCTGFLDEEFNKQRMGIDFAFFSTSTDRQVAEDFARSAEMWVLFEVAYVAACRGVDVKLLSVCPGEKGVLFKVRGKRPDLGVDLGPDQDNLFIPSHPHPT
jgi:hypothetical protein